MTRAERRAQKRAELRKLFESVGTVDNPKAPRSAEDRRRRASRAGAAR